MKTLITSILITMAMISVASSQAQKQFIQTVSTNCPAGMVDTHGGYCIDKSPQASADFQGALNHCQSRGKYLCKMVDVWSACNMQQGGFISGLTFNSEEWNYGVFEDAASDLRVILFSGCRYGAAGSAALLDESHEYRCCI